MLRSRRRERLSPVQKTPARTHRTSTAATAVSAAAAPISKNTHLPAQHDTQTKPPRASRGYYRGHLRQHFAAHADETDPERVAALRAAGLPARG